MFYPRTVLAFGICHRLYVCVRVCMSICVCVCVYVCDSLTCPHSSPVQARITKFGPEVQMILVDIHIVLGWLPLNLNWINDHLDCFKAWRCCAVDWSAAEGISAFNVALVLFALVRMMVEVGGGYGGIRGENGLTDFDLMFRIGWKLYKEHLIIFCENSR